VLGTSQNAVSLHPGGPSAYYAPTPALAIRPIAQGGGEVFGVRTCACMYGSLCLDVCMYVCLYVCMHVCCV
jgi:hypothetical protein